MAIVTPPFCFCSQILENIRYRGNKLSVVLKYFGIANGLEKYGQSDNKDFLAENSETLKIKRGLNAKKKRYFSFHIDKLPIDCTVLIKEIFTCIYDYYNNIIDLHVSELNPSQ